MVKWVAYTIIESGDKVVTISNSEGQSVTSSDPKTLLEFLYTPFRTEWGREIKFFYDVDESMSLIFRLLTVEQCQGILSTKNGTPYKLFGYEVSYSDKRNFVIRGDKKVGERPYWSCIYHLKQYVQDFDEPKDITELYELGLMVQKALDNIGITTPTTLNSAIAIWESSMRKTESTMIQSIGYIPPEHIRALDFAEKCAQHQGFITAIKVGHFNENDVYSYDQSSSYGYWLSQTRDYNKVVIEPYTPNYKFKQSICDGDVTGYFEVELTIFPHVKVHPFARRTPQGTIDYPVGTYPTFLVLEEILSIIRNKVGTVKIIDGYYFRFLNRGKPMLNIIQRLFDKRSLGIIENGLCKSIIVQMVGKSLRVNLDNGEISKTYNPPLVAHIYAMCRLQDFDFILKNHLEESVVGVATDEVISLKPATVTKIEREHKIMGTWRQKTSSPMIVLSPGWVLSREKRPHSVTYDELIKALKENPKASSYRFVSRQRVTLSKAIESGDISKVGQRADSISTVDLVELSMSQDRVFKKYPVKGQDILSNKQFESEPIKI